MRLSCVILESPEKNVYIYSDLLATAAQITVSLLYYLSPEDTKVEKVLTLLIDGNRQIVIDQGALEEIGRSITYPDLESVASTVLFNVFNDYGRFSISSVKANRLNYINRACPKSIYIGTFQQLPYAFNDWNDRFWQ